MKRTRADFHDPEVERKWSITIIIIIIIVALAIGSSVIKIINQ